MASRYEGRGVLINNFDMYKNLFKNRGVKQIRHYIMDPAVQLTQEQRSQITAIDHVWRRGDHFYKLAYEVYGDPTYWWVISTYNNMPTEANLSFGDIVFIPTPLETVLSFYGV